jgi:predicted amidophosphoribosyltransferase
MASPFVAPPPRVACPACGAAIHPIAGRCRHCRADLTRALDGPRPPAPAAAPRVSSLRPRLGFVAALVVALALAIVVPLGVS